MKRWLLFLVLLSVVGCGGENGEVQTSLALPGLEKAIDASLTMKAFARIDGTDEYDLIVYAAPPSVGGTINGLVIGTHTIDIIVQAKEQAGEIWFDIITVSKEMTISTGTTTPLDVTADDMVYPDNDGDGITNLNEVLLGTDPNNGTPLGTIEISSAMSQFTNAPSGSKRCGFVASGTLLPDPFGGVGLSLALTDIYNMSGYVYTTGLTKWLLTDSSDLTLLEFDYGPNYKDTIYPNITYQFTSAESMSCDLHLTVSSIPSSGEVDPNYFEQPITDDSDVSVKGTCNKDGESCKFCYYAGTSSWMCDI